MLLFFLNKLRYKVIKAYLFIMILKISFIVILDTLRGEHMNKKIFGLLLFILGLILHLLFQYKDNFIGIPSMIVGLSFFVYFLRSKDN